MKSRLYSLDALRGIAALAVVVWHWQHLYFIGGQPGNLRALWETEPLFPVLRTLYTSGWAAVDIFFGISGFIFFWRYREEVAEKVVGPAGFAISRVARLWPLHLLTISVVIALQAAFTAAAGHPFIYGHNGLTQFAANLLLAQGWLPGPETFNGPSWSLSVEILLYACFFVLCRRGLGQRTWPLAILCVAGFLLWVTGLHSQLGRGLMGFFLGGLVHQTVEWIRASPQARTISLAIVAAAVLVWAAIFAFGTFPGAGELSAALVRHLPSPVAAHLIHSAPKLLYLGFCWVAVPLTLSALALAEWVLGVPFRPLRLLGDISYSSYLWHFPLQLAVATAIVMNPALVAIRSGPGLAGFITVLLGLSWLSFTYFEKPMQAVARAGLGHILRDVQHRRAGSAALENAP